MRLGKSACFLRIMEKIDSQLKDVGTQGTLNVGAPSHSDGNNYGNTQDVEVFWAMKTHRHAEVYMKLISAMDPKNMKLTKFDDIIYRNFKRYFKNLPVEVIDINDFKSEKSKAAWRPFCEQFKERVEDYNFGTLLRIDCKKDYSDDNSFLVTRIQFFAIELARNKRGLNQFHLKKEQTADKENNNAEKLTEQIDTLQTDNCDER